MSDEDKPPLLERLQVVADQLSPSQLPSGDVRAVVGAIIAVQEGGEGVIEAAEAHALAVAQAPPDQPVPPGPPLPDVPGETTPTPGSPSVAELEAQLAAAKQAEVDEDAAEHPPAEQPQAPPPPPPPAP